MMLRRSAAVARTGHNRQLIAGLWTTTKERRGTYYNKDLERPTSQKHTKNKKKHKYKGFSKYLNEKKSHPDFGKTSSNLLKQKFSPELADYMTNHMIQDTRDIEKFTDWMWGTDETPGALDHTLTSTGRIPESKLLSEEYEPEKLIQSIASGEMPNTLTNHNLILRSLGARNQLQDVRNIVKQLEEQKKNKYLKPNTQTYDVLFASCAHAKEPDIAFEVLEKLDKDNVQVGLFGLTSIMNACVQANQVDRAIHFLDKRFKRTSPVKPDSAVFTVLAQGCLKERNPDKAWTQYYKLMTMHSLELDLGGYNMLMKMCIASNDIERCIQEHRFALESVDKTKWTNMVVDDHLERRTLYHTVLQGISRSHDHVHLAPEYFDKMLSENLIPNAETLVVMLACFARSGDVNNAQKIWYHMVEERKVKPNKVCYNAYLHVLAMNQKALRAKKRRPDFIDPILNTRPQFRDEVADYLEYCRTHEVPDDFLYNPQVKVEELEFRPKAQPELLDEVPLPAGAAPNSKRIFLDGVQTDVVTQSTVWDTEYQNVAGAGLEAGRQAFLQSGEAGKPDYWEVDPLFTQGTKPIVALNVPDNSSPQEEDLDLNELMIDDLEQFEKQPSLELGYSMPLSDDIDQDELDALNSQIDTDPRINFSAKAMAEIDAFEDGAVDSGANASLFDGPSVPSATADTALVERAIQDRGIIVRKRSVTIGDLKFRVDGSLSSVSGRVLGFDPKGPVQDVKLQDVLEKYVVVGSSPEEHDHRKLWHRERFVYIDPDEEDKPLSKYSSFLASNLKENFLVNQNILSEKQKVTLLREYEKSVVSKVEQAKQLMAERRSPVPDIQAIVEMDEAERRAAHAAAPSAADKFLGLDSSEEKVEYTPRSSGQVKVDTRHFDPSRCSWEQLSELDEFSTPFDSLEDADADGAEEGSEAEEGDTTIDFTKDDALDSLIPPRPDDFDEQLARLQQEAGEAGEAAEYMEFMQQPQGAESSRQQVLEEEDEDEEELSEEFQLPDDVEAQYQQFMTQIDQQTAEANATTTEDERHHERFMAQLGANYEKQVAGEQPSAQQQLDAEYQRFWTSMGMEAPAVDADDIAPSSATSASVPASGALVEARQERGRVDLQEQNRRRKAKKNSLSLTKGELQNVNLREADAVVDAMLAAGHTPDVITVNTLVKVRCEALRLNAALDSLQLFEQHGLQPDSTTHHHIVKMLCRARRVDKAHEYLTQVDSALVNASAMGEVIDAYARARRVDEARALLEEYVRRFKHPIRERYVRVLRMRCDELDIIDMNVPYNPNTHRLQKTYTKHAKITHNSKLNRKKNQQLKNFLRRSFGNRQASPRAS